jgi:hypothetical protein
MRTSTAKTARAVTSLAAAAAAVVVGLVATSTPAGAAKGGGKPPRGTTSSIQLEVVSGGDQVPNWGEDVTFHVSTTATTEPHVDLTCSQGGTVVYSATTGYYASYPWPWTQTMTLKSQMWTGGNADCTARLYMFDGSRTKTLATLPFTAYA